MTRGYLSLVAFGTLLLSAALPATAQSPLQNATPLSFSLPAQNYASNYYIDVDATAEQLTITLNATLDADVDLFVRYGTPFPTATSANFPTSPQLVSEDVLNRWSHYHSFSSTSSESIGVARSSRVPLAAGRWYVAVINSSNTATTATLTATTSAAAQVVPIAVDFSNPGTQSDPCDIAPWTDATAAAPVGGNPGTTIGAQRQNALKYAVQQITNQLQPPVPITIHACWEALGGTANKAVIANASPTTFLVDEPYYGGYVLPQRYTWYAITEAVRQGGASQCGLIGGPCGGSDDEEIKATFNADIGSPTVIGGEPFYYGYTPSAGGSLDFVSVAMHEITHGMGFIGLANTDSTQGPIGAKAGVASNTIAFQNLDLGPYDDVFDVNAAIVDTVAGTYVPFMGYEVNGSRDAARANALISTNGLRWSGADAVNSTVNLNRGSPGPLAFPLLYAPNPISNGSTLSHTVQGGDLMNAQYPTPPPRTLGLAAPMLAPLGWGTAAVAAPVYGQPFPSNWFDRSHGGHGIDFQLARRDPVFGDVYILVFYTYDQNGKPEWYLATGNIVDGVFIGGLNSNGSSLLYSTYGGNLGVGQLNPTPQSNVYGSVIVDFNQAANSPACRDVDRSGAPLLGIMHWSIGATAPTASTEDWCIEPLITSNQHATPDYSGHWFAPADGGWGMEILNFSGNAASSSIFVLVYYPDKNGLPTWAVASGTLANGTANLQLLERANGYCRTCAPPPTQQTDVIGNMTLNFTPPASSSVAANGTASFTINYPGGGSFSRSSDAITTLSLPPGQ